MFRILIAFLFVAAGLPGIAGPGGYLRQSAPLNLRFRSVPPPPPPVNGLILALGKKVEPVFEPIEPDGDVRVLAALPKYLESVVDSLVRLQTPAVSGTTNDTALAAVTPNPFQRALDDAPTQPTPLVDNVQAAAAAEYIDDILTMFKVGNEGRSRETKPAVVVAPPAFQPPRPAGPPPSSRAVYRSP